MDRAAALSQVHAALEEAEVGQAPFVKRDYLAVEDHLSLGLRRQLLDDRRIVSGQVSAIAAEKRDLTTAQERHGAKSVELRLEQPVRMRERLDDQAGQHRLELLREGGRRPDVGRALPRGHSGIWHSAVLQVRDRQPGLD